MGSECDGDLPIIMGALPCVPVPISPATLKGDGRLSAGSIVPSIDLSTDRERLMIMMPGATRESRATSGFDGAPSRRFFERFKPVMGALRRVRHAHAKLPVRREPAIQNPMSPRVP